MFLDNRFWLFMAVNFGLQLYFIVVNKFSTVDMFKVFFDNLIFVLVLYFLSGFLRARSCMFVRNAVLIFCVLIGAVDLFLISNFHSMISPSVMAVFMATNVMEGKDFAGFYFTVQNIAIVVAYLCVCGSLYAFMNFIGLRGLAVNKKLFYVTCILTIIAVSGMSIRDFIFYHDKSHVFERMHTLTKIAERVNVLNIFSSTVRTYVDYMDAIDEFHKIDSSVKNNLVNYQDYITRSDGNIPNVVLILGESHSKGWSQIYGYGLQNMPLMEKLIERGNAFVFRDVIAPDSNTSQSLKLVLTFSDHENRSTPWYKQMNLIDTMRLAGYKSIWLSNQEAVSIFGNIPSVIANRADFPFFSMLASGVARVFDDTLFDLFHNRKHVVQDYKNRFYVFHMAGSHLAYWSRYPLDRFQKFRKDDIDMTSLHVRDDEDRDKVMHYVNSIYYSDYIINGIYNLFRDEEAIIIYFSDHGQDIFQSEHFAGHRCNKYGLEIPFIVFVTDKFKQKHPDKVEDIKRAMHKRFMNDDFMHSFLPLIGIHTKDTVESKNIFSQNFDESRKRIVCKRDFDAPAR